MKNLFTENRLVFFQKGPDSLDIDEAPKTAEPQPKLDLNSLKDKLTDSEFIRVKEKKVTIDELAQEKRLVDTEIRHSLTSADRKGLISPKEIGALLEQIDANISPEKARELKKQIEDKITENENQKVVEGEVLSMDHPEIEKQHDRVHHILENNAHLIGTKQMRAFDEWFHEELERDCTIANAKDLARRLEGVDSTDQNGLYPRRQKYQELSRLFQNWGLGAPEKESAFINAEGLSERTAFHKNAIQQAYQLKISNPQFYTPQTKREIMKQMLTADSLSEQKNQINLQKKASENEAQGFIAFNESISVAGMRVKKMSQKSKDVILDFYKTNSKLSDRVMFSTHWPEAAEAEGDLYRKLEDIYGQDIEGLKLAIHSFSTLDFMSKQNALKEHEKEVKNSESKEKLHKELLIKGAHAKIDEAARKKIISSGASNSTQAKYKRWFSDPANHRDPQTRKPGSIKQLEAHLKMLTSDTPNDKAMNLKAYEMKRKHFIEHVNELKDVNPNIDSSELKKWQDRYDKAGWSEREKIHHEIEDEISAHEKNNKETKAAEEAVQMTETEKREAREVAPELKDLLVLLAQCEAEDTYESIREGYMSLFAYKNRMIQENGPDHKFSTVFLHNEAKFATLLKQKQSAPSAEAQGEDAVKRHLNSEEAQNQIDQIAIEELNEERSRQNAERLGEKSAQERAADEATENLTDEEEDLTEAFMEMDQQDHSGKSFTIEDGKAEEMTEITLDGNNLDSSDIHKQKEAIQDHSAEITQDKGFSHVIMKDESGKEMSTDERKAKVEKLSEDRLSNMAENVTKAQAVREKAKGNSFNDVASKLAAKRALRQEIEEKKRKIPQES